MKVLFDRTFQLCDGDVILVKQANEVVYEHKHVGLAKKLHVVIEVEE